MSTYMPFQQLSDPQVNYQPNLKKKKKIKSRFGSTHKRLSNLLMFIFQAENLLNFLKQLASFCLMSSRKETVSSHWIYIYAKTQSENTWENLCEQVQSGWLFGLCAPWDAPGDQVLKVLCCLSELSLSFSPSAYPSKCSDTTFSGQPSLNSPLD